MSELDKVYDHGPVEQKWVQHWIERQFAHAPADSDKPPYTIVIPPPNVTGALHMGHALTLTIQDVLIRWKRMSGYNALWLPGTDHAGIATQMVVERELAKEGLRKEDLGREQFVQRVWQWKEHYHARIVRQTNSLGASVDWSRERFTLDEGLSRAVREIFVRLYKEGLIYRADRMVNWSPGCQTVLSDLEVVYEEVDGHLWHIAYPVVGGGGQLIVATTRPETMLGDTAVAVHPEDARYQALVGKLVQLPLTDRQIPIIADETVDISFGTGAVKITPGHDPNDFEMGQRHALPTITIFDKQARMNDQVPERYRGLDNLVCRKQVVADLEQSGQLIKVDPHRHSVGHCQRSGRVAEPMVSKQWYVKMAEMAARALDAVKSGETEIVPQHWEKTYFHWLENIRDWCISRQLWWGHQIPVWYCGSCHEVTCSREDPSHCAHCGSDDLAQDPDVLDTWFSSALWPFSTLGWPDDTEDLRTFYPTTVMETGFDIIFFWVARMMMMGLKAMGQVPFKTVYLHAMVRDVEGRKMSKTKGNVIDPLELIEEHGADALRFCLAMMTAQGRDIKLSVDRVSSYHAFVTKIWNAARFSLMNLEGYGPHDRPLSELKLSACDHWILAKLNQAIAQQSEALQAFKFNDAASTIYQFFWHTYCDWYLELVKSELRSDDPETVLAAQATLVTVLDQALRLLHPFMPFVTEEIWQKLPKQGAAESLMIAEFPTSRSEWTFDGVESFDLVTELIDQLRNIRGENNIPPAKLMPAIILAPGEALACGIRDQAHHVERLARVEGLQVVTSGLRPAKSAMAVLGELQVWVPLQGLVDIDAECTRLEKELAKLDKELAGIDGKLSNESFLAKAPEAVVAKQRDRQAQLSADRSKLAAALELLR